MSRPIEAIAEINVWSNFCCGRQLVATYFCVSQEEGGAGLVSGGRLSGSDGAAARPPRRPAAFAGMLPRTALHCQRLPSANAHAAGPAGTAGPTAELGTARPGTAGSLPGTWHGEGTCSVAPAGRARSPGNCLLCRWKAASGDALTMTNRQVCLPPSKINGNADLQPQ